MKKGSILIYTYGRILGVNSPEELSQFPVSDKAWDEFNKHIFKDSILEGVINHDKENTK